MKTHAVLSALGRDRIGVADDLAAALGKRRIDIESSRWTALGGQFALVMQVCGEQTDFASLREDLGTLRTDLGFHLELATTESVPPSSGAPQYWIESFSSGPSGLSALTAVLKKHDINIEDLNTATSAAPFTSELTFQLNARITIPSSCPIPELRRELRELESEMDLDIAVKPIPRPVGHRTDSAATKRRKPSPRTRVSSGIRSSEGSADSVD